MFHLCTIGAINLPHYRKRLKYKIKDPVLAAKRSLFAIANKGIFVCVGNFLSRLKSEMCVHLLQNRIEALRQMFKREIEKSGLGQKNVFNS